MTASPDTHPADLNNHMPPSPLHDLMYGHVHAAALRAIALHGIADLLADGPRTAEDLAARSGTQAEPLRRVMRLLTARGLFTEEADGAFGLTESGTALRTDIPGSQHAAALLFTDEMVRRSTDGLTDTLRTGQPGFDTAYGVSFFQHLAAAPAARRLFDTAMTSRTGRVSEHITRSYPFPDRGTVVDIGGGRGGLLREVLTRYPGLTGVLFDQADTVADHLLGDTEALKGRWRTAAGDFFTAVPTGGQVYLLKSITHDWADEECLRILTTVRQAMQLGTRLLLIDVVLPGKGTSYPAAALDIVMLTLLRGRERTAAEFEDLLTASAFRMNLILPTSSPSSIIEAEAV